MPQHGCFYVGDGQWLVHNASSAKPTLTPAERQVLAEATKFFKPEIWNKIVEAYQSGQNVELVLNGRPITIEPNNPYRYSGLTNFEAGGFAMGPDANPLTNPGEAKKTILQELYRLKTSQGAGGVGQNLATNETKAAFEAAQRMFAHLPCQ